MSKPVYVVAGRTSWARNAFQEILAPLPGEWHFVAGPAELDANVLEALAPRYVFFLHWSWKVPPEITDRFECVVFHMTDVPYGRGGSPLQNLILRGHEETVVSAIRMTQEIDAGPVYARAPLSLAGAAHEIYARAGAVSARLAQRIIDERPVPRPQEGKVVMFERRTSAQSELPSNLSPEKAYDFIRMLDADGYPRAFIDHGPLRLTFRDARLSGGMLQAAVIIARRPS